MKVGKDFFRLLSFALTITIIFCIAAISVSAASKKSGVVVNGKFCETGSVFELKVDLKCAKAISGGKVQINIPSDKLELSSSTKDASYQTVYPFVKGVMVNYDKEKTDGLLIFIFSTIHKDGFNFTTEKELFTYKFIVTGTSGNAQVTVNLDYLYDTTDKFEQIDKSLYSISYIGSKEIESSSKTDPTRTTDDTSVVTDPSTTDRVEPSEPSSASKPEPSEPSTTSPNKPTATSSEPSEPSSVTTSDPNEPSTVDKPTPSSSGEENTTLPTTSGISVMKGDANGDGKCSMADIMIVQKHIAYILKLDDVSFARCDINGDGELKLTDILEMQKHIAFLVTF